MKRIRNWRFISLGFFSIASLSVLCPPNFEKEHIICIYVDLFLSVKGHVSKYESKISFSYIYEQLQVVLNMKCLII